MTKIHCMNSISDEGLKLLTCDYTLTDDISEAEGILVRSADMHERGLPDGLLAVARAGAGVNNIPLDKCTEKGIVVFNTPGANANAVKELVIAGMLMAARDISGGIEWVKDNKEDADISKSMEKSKKNYAGCEISGKKLGVIGLGAVGALVANAAAGLGMEVYGYDPFLSAGAAWQVSPCVKCVASVDDIYMQCDYITVHVPALDSTKGMIGKEAFDKMKDGVVILNYARDVLVDDDAMSEALASGKVHRYMTDFPNPKVTHMAGAVATPHLGASTEEAEDNCADMAVRELMSYIETGSVKNSVNYPACEMPPCRTACRICVLGKSDPDMTARLTSVLEEEKVGIAGITSKARGDASYTVIDADTAVSGNLAEKLADADGVYRVRII